MSDSKYIFLILFFLILLLVLVSPPVYLFKHVQQQLAASPVKAAKVEKKTDAIQYYDRAGEEIVYSVILGKLNLGTAIFKCLPNVQENNRVLAMMSFETKIKGFSDTETIYADALTLLPVRVLRTVKTLLKREEITEEYDNAKFTLTVIKNGGQKEKNRSVFKKTSTIHNPILLPHYVRKQPELKIGQVITANLAQRSYAIKLAGIEDIKLKTGLFKTYHFESSPKQIEIWLTNDKDRIPVKILGLGLFPYALEMTKYIPPKNARENTLQP